MASIRAVYHKGQLELLDPVDLDEGQEVRVQILDGKLDLEELIGDMLVKFEYEGEPIEDEDALLKFLHEQTKHLPPFSETIIQERSRDE